jgi:uncharacterized protein YqeY
MFAESLKNRTLELRKSRDPMGTFLVAVYSAAQNIAKVENPSNPEVSDQHALKAINSFIKGSEETMSLVKDPTAEAHIRAKNEYDLLKSFLPTETSEEDVKLEINSFIENSTGMVGDRKKLMGPLMTHLNKTFGASLNKKVASTLAQQAINA